MPWGGKAMTTAIGVDLHVGRRLVAARRLRDLSQEALAKKLNVTPEQVDGYEQGPSFVTAGQLYDVARALEIKVSFFYEGLNGASACPYSLSEERYAVLKRTVQRIAADHEFTAGGCRKKLPLHMAVEIARDLCDTLGWSYESELAAAATVNPLAEGAP